MNDINHQMFGLFGDKYYAVDECDRIVIPNNIDYKSSALVTKIHDCTDEAEIDAYQYYSDLMTESNDERVTFMKEFLLGEKITDIEKITDNYVVGIKYTLYNKEGKVVKSGTSEIDAQWCMPIILSDVKKDNKLEYRKGLILDGRIEICIPDIVRYGIRNSANQHPYTLRISEIFALSTNGGYKYITETGSQLDTADDCSCGASTSLHAHAHDAHYKMRHHNGLCDVNFNSCFVTNAKIGTTIIDNVVTSAVLEAPPSYEKIDLCHIPLSSSDFIVKINHKLRHIIINLEIFIDNMNEVYDREDIAKLLQYNAGIEDDDDNSFNSDNNQCNCCSGCVKPPKDDHHHCYDKDTPDDGDEEEDEDSDMSEDPDTSKGDSGGTSGDIGHGEMTD